MMSIVQYADGSVKVTVVLATCKHGCVSSI